MPPTKTTDARPPITRATIWANLKRNLHGEINGPPGGGTWREHFGEALNEGKAGWHRGQARSARWCGEAPPLDTATPQERAAWLDQQVATRARHGWAVESRTETQVVLTKGHRPSHVLHLLLTLLTCGLWIPVWILLSIHPVQRKVINI